MKEGVCPVCQQSGVSLVNHQVTDGEWEAYHYTEKVGEEVFFVLASHPNQSGQSCEGAFLTPQAVYDVEDRA